MRECNQCGKCCIAYGDGGLSATATEIQWWQVFRPQIAQYVHQGEIWMDPATGQRLTRCPFLHELPGSTRNGQPHRQYGCSIYHDRPEDCRHYPVNVAEMIRDECEMLEPQDLLHPQRAQVKLDKLMANSRPSQQ